jgi:methylenetetrahydrofolate dehydrogenase (NADP+) / methenyltetrahydrofolate cyclohydrolase
MTARILNGKLVANEIQTYVADKVRKRIECNQRVPGLAVIMVGQDPASQIYVRNKRIACERLGFYSLAFDLPQEIKQEELEDIIHTLNEDEKIDGIIVQIPLPPHLDCSRIIEKIRFDKDVDGFHPYNIGRLALRQPLLRPCTPFGIIKLLQYYAIQLRGIHAVIVGASNIVGRPLALELLMKGATVTICHKYTQDLSSKVKSAELLVVAIGNQDVISPKWLQKDVIIVDVGINRLSDGKITGDIDFRRALEIASWITPVPGGVGPMTVTMLLENTLYAAERFHPHTSQ